ncbi:glycosyl hydrolase family 95 catalytic domain-containing protein [Paracidobacterium acidisoli]|uniref:Glycosyl hydrolase family 95 catalytic domain-containing protein n=1 Tax=Paracidobacterium acidisoli TaxID=2303751 RepID=A0A372IK84_9BACT|nr:twin-arginine translocation signal domain-containing protein [Paracidobacterium acidisoli]MBT9332652.1 twin-arginine translocation signal domain-containing protein [Paracidobacterium acidisoli]
MKRRNFLKASLAAGAAASMPRFVADALSGVSSPHPSPSASIESSTLPWQREISLREAAGSVVLQNRLDPANPLPDSGEYFGGPSMSINNLKMRTTIWGPAYRVTISLNKNNVWDRRLNVRALESPTLQEITAGAFSPANADYIGRSAQSQRPRDLGYLLPKGGTYDPYRQPIEYPFPCMKPVGQIILGIDALEGADAPQVTQSCANGLVKLHIEKGAASAGIEYILGMTSNTYAVRGTCSGIDQPVSLRLYRHRDTAHMAYMSADGKTYTKPEAAPDKAFNGPIDPPSSGKSGRYFWIHQRLPAEKTFPQGFEYVLMGVLLSPQHATLDAVQDQTGLGTPPPNAEIAAAPGAAATATFIPGAGGKFEALVTIVTSMDGPHLLTLAQKRLEEAQAKGFDGIVQENTDWWNRFYDQRENGRIFHGTTGSACSDNVKAIYRSYTDSHGGGTKTDMRQFECSASYAFPERDIQLWTSAPCYNEIFYTGRFVQNWGDSEDMWKQIIWHWTAAAEENARHIFNLPGMYLVHGYLPPIKADKYIHTTITLEFCMDTMAQIVKPSWDEWDYGGDIRVLRDECYPIMRRMALFYAAYAHKGDDGRYHIVPCMEAEKWGFYPKFSHNKDIISSLCMFRWGLSRAADAAELLGVDEDLRRHWREIAERIAPYPVWQGTGGPEFTDIEGIEPIYLHDDHFGEAAFYPTLLADEVNLDSPQEQRESMLRSIQSMREASTSAPTSLLLGVEQEGRNSHRQKSEEAEMLLNSRSGRVHLFPVVGPEEEVAFRNFQARGGFLVSACRDAGGVSHVEIHSRRNIPCRLMNPWPGKQVTVRDKETAAPVPAKLDTANGECLVFSTHPGRTYLVHI